MRDWLAEIMTLATGGDLQALQGAIPRSQEEIRDEIRRLQRQAIAIKALADCYLPEIDEAVDWVDAREGELDDERGALSPDTTTPRKRWLLIHEAALAAAEHSETIDVQDVERELKARNVVFPYRNIGAAIGTVLRDSAEFLRVSGGLWRFQGREASGGRADTPPYSSTGSDAGVWEEPEKSYQQASDAAYLAGGSFSRFGKTSATPGDVFRGKHSGLAEEIMRRAARFGFEPKGQKTGYVNLSTSGRAHAQIHPHERGVAMVVREADGELPPFLHLEPVRYRSLGGYRGSNKNWLDGDGKRFTFKPAAALLVPAELESSPDDPGWQEVDSILRYAQTK